MDPSRLLDRFLRYVRCDSESGDERAFCELIESELRAMGVPFSRDEVGERACSNGWNIFASLPGQGEPILFSAHLDTVPPGKGIRPVVADGVVRSSGDTVLGADDKSGVAAIMEALETMVQGDAPHRPVEVLFTVCEELGLYGSRYADYSPIRSRQAVVLDGGRPGIIVNKAPAHVMLTVTIQGRSAHAAAAPEQGIHAIKAAADAIAAIPCGRVDEETVMNVGTLHADGKPNIVPALAVFEMEIRSHKEELLQKRLQDTQDAIAAACRTYGASYTIESERHAGALDVPADSPLIQKLQAVCRELGAQTAVEGGFGNSDATWIFGHGIDAVNIGTGMSAVHGVGEHIKIADLENTARLVLAMTRP